MHLLGPETTWIEAGAASTIADLAGDYAAFTLLPVDGRTKLCAERLQILARVARRNDIDEAG